MNIQEIRQKYPQYSDMSDEQLASALHQKFYSDMPYDDFSSKIGLTGAQAQPEARSTGQELVRQGGLTLRHGLEGLAGVAGIVVNPINATIAKATGGPFETLQDTTGRLLTRAGLPQPETKTEELVGAMSRAVAGGGGMIRGAQAIEGVAPAAAELLTARPATQLASAATGSGAAEAARQNGIGTMGQVAAGIIGALIPGASLAAGSAAVRAGFRGGEAGRQTVENNIRLFNEAGTTPSVGQATENRVMRGAETLLSRVPGGAGPIVGKAGEQAQQLSSSLDQAASSLSPAAGAAKAGLSVERGIRGDGGFVESFKARQSQLYDQLDKFIGPQAQVKVDATRKALDALTADIPGAPNLSQWFKNARIAGIRGALVKDTEGTDALLTRSDIPDAFKKMLQTQDGAELAYTLRNLQDGTLPYEAVKKLRTLVGNEMADSGLASDVPRSKWKALYGALSEDLGSAVRGDKQAEAAWNRANTYTRVGMQRLDVLDRVLDKNGGPEAVFKAATSGTKDGAFVLRSVMQSLPKDNQRDLAAAMLRRMGRSVSSKQNEAGDAFSTETMLTNWNNLSPEAKVVLFNRFGAEFRRNMDRVAKVAANLREGSQVYANPSGTSQGVAQASLGGAAILALLRGDFASLGAITGAVTSANLASRLMVNPDFVGWLAKTTQMPISALNQQAVVLANIAKRGGDQDIAAFADAIKRSGQEQTQQQGQ